MTQSNDDGSKLGQYAIFVGLGLLCTTLITVLGIWGDDEIIVHQKILRSPSPIDNREVLSRSLSKAVSQSFTSHYCKQPEAFFASLSIGQAPISEILDSATKRPEGLTITEHEVYRRCAERKKSSVLKTCFTFHPNTADQEGFLEAETVIAELYMSFRDPINREGLTCQRAFSRLGSQALIYYTLHWKEGDEQHRITGGAPATLNTLMESRKEEAAQYAAIKDLK